ncbi:MAG TPA: hypothetical protein VGI20_09990 [Rhizomicrobium sp.]
MQTSSAHWRSTPPEPHVFRAGSPRLRFKARFLELFTDHCRRKPNSQRATWLEGFCHATAPQPPGPPVADALAQAPFAE